jgi:hypothetical protein
MSRPEISTDGVPQPRVTTSKPTAALTAGWICLVIGVAILLLSPVALILIHPWLFLAAFVLSIVAMAKGRIAGGIFLLLASVIMPAILFVGLVGYQFAQAVTTEQVAQKSAIANLAFEDVKGTTSGDYVYVEGRIRNNGKEHVKFIKVAAEALDKSGAVLDSEWTYAVGGEGIAPAAAKSFRVMIRRDKRMTNFTYKFLPD